ncbi:MAG: MarR family transcriptional regulator [Actinobacteria bacterium]|nr:MarR family transcriptional regulator [Actinomycetota bacterium]
MDQAMQSMRRVVLRPPALAVPMPRIGKPVEISKVLACEAIGELSKRPGPVTISDVAAALQLDRSTTSRLVAEVEEEGFVTRGSLPEDGRRVSVALTPLGAEIVEFAHGLRVAYLDHACAVFTDDELAILGSLLWRLADSMGESLAPWLESAVRYSTPADSSATT